MGGSRNGTEVDWRGKETTARSNAGHGVCGLDSRAQLKAAMILGHVTPIARAIGRGQGC